MPTFVHLTPESKVAVIKRNGINRLRNGMGDRPTGVFAVPVTRNYYLSHQWLRELKRKGQGPIAGIYFRIPDSEILSIGHYGQAHQRMTAAEAVAEFMSSESREGWEVIIPRRVEANEIQRVRTLSQVIGWRFYPAAKGKAPCPCSFCTRGDYGGRRLRERLGDE